jgi:hypothetical protein
MCRNPKQPAEHDHHAMSYHPHAMMHKSKPVYHGHNDPTLAIFATLERKPDQNARKNTLQTLTIICLCQARQRNVTFNSFNLVQHWHHIEGLFTMAAAAAPRAHDQQDHVRPIPMLLNVSPNQTKSSVPKLR